MASIPEAIKWKLGVNCSKTPDGQGVDVWESELPKPSPAECAAIVAEYEAHLAATAYIKKRREEYPPIGDQLDALWKIVSDLAGTFEDQGGALEPTAAEVLHKVKSVKEKYPKP